jgi:hypothetical protein
MAHSPPSLRTNRAFVGQLRALPPGPSAAYDARDEPMVSGQLASFQSMGVGDVTGVSNPGPRRR